MAQALLEAEIGHPEQLPYVLGRNEARHGALRGGLHPHVRPPRAPDRRSAEYDLPNGQTQRRLMAGGGVEAASVTAAARLSAPSVKVPALRAGCPAMRRSGAPPTFVIGDRGWPSGNRGTDRRFPAKHLVSEPNDVLSQQSILGERSSSTLTS